MFWNRLWGIFLIYTCTTKYMCETDCGPTAVPPTPQIKKVTSVPCPQSNPRPVDSWVDSISALHRSKPPASVQYSRPMPSIDSLMQEWPPEVEELLQRHPPPTAALSCSTAQYADLICALLDIPVNSSRIQSLHLLFSLYLEFRGLQHFSNAQWRVFVTENFFYVSIKPFAISFQFY